ncbi:MAG: PIG-L family deacetylase, partial [Pseudomonadota bacterium]
DETAEMRFVVPEHPLLRSPNRLGAADFDGWVQERGLYFAKSWDEAYTPLLEMADPDEQPHRGILLAADIGQGRHIHTSLILHHQMEKLVPGAFRIMANLIAKR